MRRVLTFLLIFSVLLIPMPAFAEEDAGAWALDVLDQLANGDFETVYENSDVAMQDALGSADGMASVWAPVSYTHLDVYKRQALGPFVVRKHCFIKNSFRLPGSGRKGRRRRRAHLHADIVDIPARAVIRCV